MESHWKHIPDDIIKNWLNILSCHVKSKFSSEIKISILNGIKQMVSNKHSHSSVKSFLSNFVNQIYYADIDVVKCFTELIIYLQNHIGILIWDIVALTTLLKCIEVNRFGNKQIDHLYSKQLKKIYIYSKKILPFI